MIHLQNCECRNNMDDTIARGQIWHFCSAPLLILQKPLNSTAFRSKTTFLSEEILTHISETFIVNLTQLKCHRTWPQFCTALKVRNYAENPFRASCFKRLSAVCLGGCLNTTDRLRKLNIFNNYWKYLIFPKTDLHQYYYAQLSQVVMGPISRCFYFGGKHVYQPSPRSLHPRSAYPWQRASHRKSLFHNFHHVPSSMRERVL